MLITFITLTSSNSPRYVVFEKNGRHRRTDRHIIDLIIIPFLIFKYGTIKIINSYDVNIFNKIYLHPTLVF